MALYKKEIVVRPTSTATYDQAITATRNFVNGFQNDPANKNGTAFIDFFFGDCFDSRNGNIYRVFSDACATEYSMPHVNGLIKYTILDNSVMATKAELTPLATKEYVDTEIAGLDLGGDVDLTDINNTLADHETRIEILESAESGTVAYVIE